MIMGDRLFYEYAITPDVFHGDYISGDKRLEIILPELLKGICDNGMIANLNKDSWFKVIMNDCLPTIMTPDFKKKLIFYLNMLQDRHRLVRHPKSTHGNPSTDIEWFKLALESHERIKFDGIIASWSVLSTCGAACEDFLDTLYVLDSAKWNGRRRTLTLNSSEPYYRPVLDPILRHAKSLIIVDPYFSPHVQKYKNFLNICIKQMGSRGASRLSGRIHIHTGDPNEDINHRESVDERLNAWERCIKGLAPASIPHKIQIFIRKKWTRGKRFHDRFILTDQCCVDIPMGTDTYDESTPNSTTWALLDYEDMQKKAEEIDPAMKIYNTLGERLII
jgi:hypothetical protein